MRSSLLSVVAAFVLAATFGCRSTPPPRRATGTADHPKIDFAVARSVLERAILARAFPGCAVAVGRSHEALWVAAFGSLDYEGGAPATVTTHYDIASLTKVVGTTSVLMALVRDGKMDLDAPLGTLLPRLGLERKGLASRDSLSEVPLHALLTHTSGLPAWKPFYKTVDSYAALIDAVLATAQAHGSGEYRYSDLGFILLGEVAARAGGKPLATLEQELIFRPLAMSATTRRPSSGLDVAPTEEIVDSAGHRAALRGIVHDENARAAQGLTGHAGLFSTAVDLAKFATGLLQSARANGSGGRGSAIDSHVLRRFLQSSPDGLRHGRAFGWQLAGEGRSSGSLLSQRAFGHTGFTGTSLWIDPERDLYILLLSNRVHPTRSNRQISAVRRHFADAVVQAIEESEN